MPIAKTITQRPLERDHVLMMRQLVDFGGTCGAMFGILLLTGVVTWWGLLPLARLVAVPCLASCIFFMAFWALSFSYKSPTRNTQTKLCVLREASSAANASLSAIEKQGRSVTNLEAWALLRKHGRLREASLAGCRNHRAVDGL